MSRRAVAHARRRRRMWRRARRQRSASAATEAPDRFGPVVLGPRAGGPERRRGRGECGVFEAPRHGTVVLVDVGRRRRGIARCRRGARLRRLGVETAALLVDVGGRVPRPTLIASASAHRLEERLAARLPMLRPAARGEVCHLSVAADEDGLAAAGTAVTSPAAASPSFTSRRSCCSHCSTRRVRREPDAALLRADLAADRALVALAVDDLVGRGLRVAVLKRRLGWVAERRAGFGALGSDSGGLPESLVRRCSAWS